MKTIEETIKVIHNSYGSDSGENEKRFSYSFGDYRIFVRIDAEDGCYPGLQISFWNEKVEDGVQINAKRRGDKLVFSIDHTDGEMETRERDYEGWIELERLNSAIQILKTALV